MAKLFTADPGLTQNPSGRLPQFSLVVSAATIDGWHKAVLVRAAADPEFFLRSIAVPWSFVIARPAPSMRQNDATIRPESLSPARTSPARKLVVNWAWQRVDGGNEHLPFYVRRVAPLLLSPKQSLALRLHIKEQPAPQRRYRIHVASNVTDWRLGMTAFVGEQNSAAATG